MIEEERKEEGVNKKEEKEPEPERDLLLENRIEEKPAVSVPEPVEPDEARHKEEKPAVKRDPIGEGAEDEDEEEEDEEDEEDPQCPPGYELAVLAEDDEESSPCADVDECSQKDKNGCSHICINTEGGIDLSRYLNCHSMILFDPCRIGSLRLPQRLEVGRRP